MNKRYKLTISLFALVLSTLASATAATAPPKVVFVGDYITAQWASAFAANPNWINLGAAQRPSGWALRSPSIWPT
jgi:hypothetical protein